MALMILFMQVRPNPRHRAGLSFRPRAWKLGVQLHWVRIYITSISARERLMSRYLFIGGLEQTVGHLVSVEMVWEVPQGQLLLEVTSSLLWSES